MKGLIQDLPEFIEVSINGLGIGQSVKVESIQLANLEILDSPANAIVSVKTSRVVAKLDDQLEEGAEGEESEGEESSETSEESTDS